MRILISVFFSVVFSFHGTAQNFNNCNNSIAFDNSNLPIVIINTPIDPLTAKPRIIPDDPKILASMKIVYRPDGSRNYLSDQTNAAFLNYNGAIEIELRGSTSQLLCKKPYSLTTLKSTDFTNNNVSILGMPPENDWVLHSLAYDPSMIRDFLSFDLARAMGNYASRGKYCEVVVNGDYKGLYIFMEKIKIDDNRVNLVKLTTTDNAGTNLTGGYIVKADKTNGDPVAWSMATTSPGFASFIHDKPNPLEITPQQSAYISGVFRSLETAMAAQNESMVNGYPSIIDVPSFVDFMLINEISSNADAYQYSTFFHKDRQGKLRAGPIWDFNLTYGNDLKFWGLNRSFTNVWQFNNGDNTGPKFWYDLYRNSTFKCYLSKRWNELTQPGQAFHSATINAKIDSLKLLVAEAAKRDEARWGNNIADFNSDITLMKSWVLGRIDWMGSNLNNFSSCANPTIPSLVISKINYNPLGATGLPNSNLEFIEITNKQTTTVILTGIYLKELGVSYQFAAASSIQPGEKIYLSSDTASFRQYYGFAAFGQFTRNLSNSSEKLVLANAFGDVIDLVQYQDISPWPIEADGLGSYLQLKDINLDNSLASSWVASDPTCLMVPSFNASVSYCLYDTPSPLKATASTGSTLLWYGNASTGGTSSTIVPTPVTTAISSMAYYVSQKNNTTGCESPRFKITVWVSAVPQKPEITRDNSNNLVSTLSEGNQWYKDGIAIPNATASLYKPSVQGLYYVKPDVNGCLGPVSNSYYFVTTAVSDLSKDEFIRLSPNPFKDYVYIDFKLKSNTTISVYILDLNGNIVSENKKISKGYKIDMSRISSGIYFVHAKDDKGKILHIQKIIKN